ncbi:MAG: glycosyltransferase family 4 protein [Arcobacteraceae bacterium]|jgi:glycosyltransferase involved in cell wall biosynthesis|nr:glycosyltransferase family 4 protein [Arcobacteraceae bacterium]
MKYKLVHILMTDYQLDSRVRNETVSLVNDGYEVDVYCLKSKKISAHEVREKVNLKRFGIVGNKILTFLTAYVGMFIYSLGKKIDSVHAHDVNALPIAYIIALIKRVPLIYDTHELWSQSHHSISSQFVLNCVAFMEKLFAKRATKIITVSDSIKTYLEKYFAVNDIEVIRNIPSYTHSGKYNIFREKYNLSEDIRICLYQGLISKTRGVDLIVKAALEVCKKNDNVVFFFLGDGPYLEELKQLVIDSNLEDKIYILGKIEQNELLKYTMSADIGVHAISNTCLNHEYCLPNKVFEYIHAHVVLVVTNLLELSKFVEENQVGITFEDNDAKSLEESLNKILVDNELYNKFKSNSMEASQKLTWDNEYKVLKKLYEDILK